MHIENPQEPRECVARPLELKSPHCSKVCPFPISLGDLGPTPSHSGPQSYRLVWLRADSDIVYCVSLVTSVL